MAHFLRSSRGIVTKSLQFQKCFSRSFMMSSSNAKPVVNVPHSVPGSQVEKLKICEMSDRDYFEVRNLFTIKDLFDAQVHYGYHIANLNEDMRKFIIERKEEAIFDLDQTAELLGHALHFIAETAFRGGIILFMSKFKENTLSLEMENTILECTENYTHTRFGRKGTFTDLSCSNYITRPPDLIIFLDTLDEGDSDVLEAHKLSIPTVGIVHIDCSPSYITYPIPGNNFHPKALELYCNLFRKAILQGWTKRTKFIEKYKDDID